MGIHVVFFRLKTDSFLELLRQDYTLFRKWILEKARLPQHDAFEKAHTEVQSFLRLHETLPAINEMGEKLLNQLTAHLVFDYYGGEEGKDVLDHTGPSVHVKDYRNEPGFLTEDEVLYCWNFLLHGRSVKDAAHFFNAIETDGQRLGYWSVGEQRMLAEKLGKMFRRGNFPAVTAVLEVLERNNKHNANLFFSIV